MYTPVVRATIPGLLSSETAHYHDLTVDIRSEQIDRDRLMPWIHLLGVATDAEAKLASILQKLWAVWRKYDVIRLQVDVGLTSDGHLVLTKPSLYIDPFSLFRQPEMVALADHSQTLPLEFQASEGKLFYLKKPGGNIGLFGYGAGVALATMDTLAMAGGKPANFLDGGGGATPANVRAGISLLFADSDVRTIFINSFGGLTNTELIAQSVVEIMRERKAANTSVPPTIVRLRGTGAKEAENIIGEAKDLPSVKFVGDVSEAAEAAVAAARGL